MVTPRGQGITLWPGCDKNEQYRLWRQYSNWLNFRRASFHRDCRRGAADQLNGVARRSGQHVFKSLGGRSATRDNGDPVAKWRRGSNRIGVVSDLADQMAGSRPMRTLWLVSAYAPVPAASRPIVSTTDRRQSNEDIL